MPGGGTGHFQVEGRQKGWVFKVTENERSGVQPGGQESWGWGPGSRPGQLRWVLGPRGPQGSGRGVGPH